MTAGCPNKFRIEFAYSILILNLEVHKRTTSFMTWGSFSNSFIDTSTLVDTIQGVQNRIFS